MALSVGFVGKRAWVCAGGELARTQAAPSSLLPEHLRPGREAQATHTHLLHMRKEKASKEIQKYTELNENVNEVLQNVWETAKAVGKFITLNVYIRKEGKSQIN